VTEIVDRSIRELAEFRSSESPVVSCYLDVDGRRHVRSQDVDAEFQRLVRSAGTRADGATADLARIETYLRSGFDRSNVRGLVMFSCEDRDLWTVVPLPVSVTSQLVVNTAPAVGQLESVMQELEPVGVLLVDRQSARMFVFAKGELVDHSELFDETPRDIDTRGHSDRGRASDDQHVEELVTQHVRHAAEVAFSVWQVHPFQHLVVSAHPALQSAVRPLLHPYLRERLTDPVELPIGATEGQVRDTVTEVSAALERSREVARVGRLRDELARGGRAASGLDDTLDALNRRRVEVLFVSSGYAESGWRAADGSLFRVGPKSPLDGSDMERLDNVVEEAVDLAIATSCLVDVVVDSADLDVVGRFAALLRY
jgi:hypothetical protein